MAIDRKELGRRLRLAREAAGLTQEAVAGKLGLSRASVTQMELGNRAVSSLELDKLAYLYGREIRSFLEPEFDPHDALTFLFRANPDLVKSEYLSDALRRAVALGREFTNLENLLRLSTDSLMPAVYPLKHPANKWEAIRQGESMAQEERRRLDLGDGPLPDMVGVLENLGVRTAIIPLPEDVSGITIKDSAAGILVAVNAGHAPMRQRFSFAHEFAHVLLDRDRPPTVSSGSNREELLEVRANAFAASFLLPEPGLRQFIATLGKGQKSRAEAKLFDGEQVISVKARIPARSQEIQVYDVLLLAHSFGVSPSTALFRLRNIHPPLIDDEELADLQSVIESKAGQIKETLKLEEMLCFHRNVFQTHFLALAFEAYRRDKISRSKLVELAEMAGLGREQVETLLESLRLDRNGEEESNGAEE